MTAPELVTAGQVREFFGESSTTGRWSDHNLGSNIRAATWMLERATGRFFADKTATLKFTTNGETYLTIPGLRTASSVSLQGTALTADESYWLIPDLQQTGVATGIQFRAFGTDRAGPWWLSNPEWFDRNLDSRFHPANRGGGRTSLPNDLAIAGSWGYAAADMPEPALLAVKALAAFFTLRPDAVLTGARVTPEGNVQDLSVLPLEAQTFIASWYVGPWAFQVG